MNHNTKTIVAWILRIVSTLIMLQTLFFKFSAAEESVYIFSRLGIEPWGRITTGIMELIASVLILVPRTTAWGALMALGIMGGAILSHIFVLGISVQNDGGQLFLYASLVFVCSLILVLIYQQQILRHLPARFLPSTFSK